MEKTANNIHNDTDVQPALRLTTAELVEAEQTLHSSPVKLDWERLSLYMTRAHEKSGV